MVTPVIYTAFSNDRDNYLPFIKQERKNISRSFRRLAKQGNVVHLSEGGSSTEDVFEIFREYNQQINIFHYGGHAGGSHLDLETEEGGSQKAYVQGLALLLGEQKSLKLVFLNGCATREQVDVLLENGVPSVIATSVQVQDRMATLFATQFYANLSDHNSISESFDRASAFISTKYKEGKDIVRYTGLKRWMYDKPASEYWGLYVNEDAENILDWRIPRLNQTQLQDRKNREVLLNKIRQFWIDGVLYRSLIGNVIIHLDKELRQDMVNHPWEEVIKLPKNNHKNQRSEVSILEHFDNADRLLLILGEPGSGKTITMLQLAEKLIILAGQDHSLPIPIILNLSTWDKTLPVKDWLNHELSHRYQIPKRVTGRWLYQHRLLFMLDGLDEVAEADRAACVVMINDLTKDHGSAGLVVCSRMKEYELLQEKINLHQAIIIKPLEIDQLWTYFNQLNDPAVNIFSKTIFSTDKLLTLANNPLFLNVMISTFANDPSDLKKIDSGNVSESRSKLMGAYTQHVMERKGTRIGDQEQKRLKFQLGWIANKMTQSDQDYFTVGNIQPSYLNNRRQKWMFQIGARMILGILFMIAMIPFTDIIFNVADPVSNHMTGKAGLGISILITVALTGLIEAMRIDKNGGHFKRIPLPQTGFGLFVLVYFLLVGSMYLIDYFFPRIIIFSSAAEIKQEFFWFWIPLYAMIAITPFIFRKSLFSWNHQILATEKISWSLRKVKRSKWLHILTIFLLILSYFWYVGFYNFRTEADDNTALFFTGFELFLPMISFVLLASIYALKGIQINRQIEPNPKDGDFLKITTRNIMYWSGIFLIISIVIIFPLNILIDLLNEFSTKALTKLQEAGDTSPYIDEQLAINRDNVRMNSPTVLLMYAILTLLWFVTLFGLDNIIKHYLLRIWLKKKDQVDLFRINEVLKTATDLTLMRQVGNGYMFLHQYFLEYFAKDKLSNS